MDKEFIKDFHVLPTSKGYVVFHSLSYRFFEVDEDTGKVLLSLEMNREKENNISAIDVKKAKDLLLKEVGENSFSLKNNALGEREGLAGFYLFVSQDCNLKCSYCYGDGGDYRKGKMLMDEATARNFLERFIDGRQRQYVVNLFGGEPLLNFSLIKKFVLEAKAKARSMGFKINFNITTNGTIWNSEIRDFIKDHITNITVSLDGPKEINDIQRIPMGDFSPHDRTLETLKELRRIKENNYVIRTIVTKNSFNKVGEVYRYNIPLASGGLGVTPVDVDPSHPLALTEEEHRVMVEGIVKKNTENLFIFSTEDAPQFYGYTFDLFELMFFKKYRPRPCNAGKTVVAVAADGELYPCHRFVGYKEFAVGNVNNREPLNGNYQQILGEFKRATVDSMERCNLCWARYMCGGCCYTISYLREGNVAIPWREYCYLKEKSYHALLSDFIGIMTDPTKKERFVTNVKMLLKRRGQTAC